MPGPEIGVLAPGLVFPTVPTQFESGATGGKNHTLFFFETNWVNDTGIVQMPVAGPLDTPCQILDWSGGWWAKVITWAAVCEGAFPSLPSDAPEDPVNERLKFRTFIPQAPSLMIDGVNYVYQVKGYYWYILVQKPDFSRGLPLGRQPWDGGPQQVLTASNFDSHATGVGPTALGAAGANGRITIPSP